MKTLSLGALLCMLLLPFAAPVQAQVAVIAHPGVKAAQAGASEVMAIYTLKKTTWSDGVKVVVLDLQAETPTKAAFQRFIGIGTTELRKEWMRAQLTGQGQPPEALSTEEAILAKVAGTPGAIGYVSAAKVTAGVKVIATIP